MAAKLSPITPSVLEWALSEDGRSRARIAEVLGIEIDTLADWIDGDARPTAGQVTALAEALARPRLTFFLPGPPSAASLPTSFRHPPGDSREVGAAARRRVRQARRLQDLLSEELSSGRPVEVPRFALSTAPAEAAAQTRRWLEISDADQTSWSNDYDALRDWRSALEERGVFVFSLEVGERLRLSRSDSDTEEIRGFSAWDDYAPLIVLNSLRINAAARIFTLGHELGHLVTRTDAACVDDLPLNDGQPLERWCEEFAAALLMPEPAFRAELNQRSRAVKWSGIDEVGLLMRAFRVSARAAALRLIELGYASPDLYADVLRVFRPRPPDQDVPTRGSGTPMPQLRIRQFGPRALATLLQSDDELETLSTLGITVAHAREIEDRITHAPSV